MVKITPSQFDDLRTSGSDPFILDIRPRDTFERGHIEESYNVPVYAELQRGNDESLYGRLDEVPTDRPIVVVCKAGIVARRATAVLNEEGFNASTLLGGMSGWKGYENDTVGYRVRSLLWRLTS